MLAVEVKLAILGLPHAEDDLKGLARAFANGGGVDAKERKVGGKGANADAPVEAPPGHVVQHGDAVGDLGGMMHGQQGDAGGEDNLLGHGQSLGDEQFRGRCSLPTLGDVFTDPALAVA